MFRAPPICISLNLACHYISRPIDVLCFVYCGGSAEHLWYSWGYAAISDSEGYYRHSVGKHEPLTCGLIYWKVSDRPRLLHRRLDRRAAFGALVWNKPDKKRCSVRLSLTFTRLIRLYECLCYMKRILESFCAATRHETQTRHLPSPQLIEMNEVRANLPTNGALSVPGEYRGFGYRHWVDEVMDW